MPNRRSTGALGERLARRYLEQRGYRIVACNWSSLYGEIDIIAERGGILVFVEVKARRDEEAEVALAGVTMAKRQRMINAVHLYLHNNEIELDWRIDVIGVALRGGRSPRIEHVEDAFDW